MCVHCVGVRCMSKSEKAIASHRIGVKDVESYNVDSGNQSRSPVRTSVLKHWAISSLYLIAYILILYWYREGTKGLLRCWKEIYHWAVSLALPWSSISFELFLFLCPSPRYFSYNYSLNWCFIAVIEHYNWKESGEERINFSLQFHFTVHTSEGVRAGSQRGDRNLKVRREVEAIEECCLPDYSLWIARPSFLYHLGPPKPGCYHTLWDIPTHINQWRKKIYQRLACRPV